MNKLKPYFAEPVGGAVFKTLRSATGTSIAIRQQANMRVLKTASTSGKQNGFIALITAIILSVILLVVTIAMNQTSFLTRSEVLESEYKNRSVALAEGCADTAMLRLANNPAYAGNEASISIGTDTCSIGAIQQDTPTLGQVTINARAVFPAPGVTSQGAITKLIVVVESSDISVVSWVEVP